MDKTFSWNSRLKIHSRDDGHLSDGKEIGCCRKWHPRMFSHRKLHFENWVVGKSATQFLFFSELVCVWLLASCRRCSLKLSLGTSCCCCWFGFEILLLLLVLVCLFRLLLTDLIERSEKFQRMGSVAATSSSWKDSPLAFPSSFSSSCNPNRFNNNTPCSTSSSRIKCFTKWVSAANEIGSNTPKDGKKITCKKESSSSSELRTRRSLHHHHLLLPLRHSHSFITHSSSSSSSKTKKKLPRQLVKTRFEEEDKEECASPPASPPPPPPRPPFDLDLAVLLAGFAFEAYNTPKAKVGLCECNAGDCETIYLAKGQVIHM